MRLDILEKADKISPTMKTYKIGVVWQVYGYVEVEADSLTEAVLIAEDAPLPDNGEYIQGSFEVDHDGFVEEV